MCIQDQFNVALGTSSGGLIVLGLFLNGWTVPTCLDQLVSLAESAFQRRWLPWLPLIDILIMCLTDSRYGAKYLQEALKSAVRNSRTMLESGPFNTMVAVTATTTNNPKHASLLIMQMMCPVMVILLPDWLTHAN